MDYLGCRAPEMDIFPTGVLIRKNCYLFGFYCVINFYL